MFNVNLHLGEYLVSISSLQWRAPHSLGESVFEMPIVFVEYPPWQNRHRKMEAVENNSVYWTAGNFGSSKTKATAEVIPHFFPNAPSVLPDDEWTSLGV